MILVGSQNKFGNILHLIIGPETELMMDIHGSIVMDITSFIQTIPKDAKVLVNVSRCRTELLTSSMLNASGIPHICTSMNVVQADGDQQQPQTTKSEVKGGVCKLCGNPAQLPIQGLQLCEMCIRIELGLKKNEVKHGTGTV